MFIQKGTLPYCCRKLLLYLFTPRLDFIDKYLVYIKLLIDQKRELVFVLTTSL